VEPEEPSVMVFDSSTNPVWCGKPKACRRWLSYQLETNPAWIAGYKVRIEHPNRFELVPYTKYLSMREKPDD
jgi:hypothetical protein